MPRVPEALRSLGARGVELLNSLDGMSVLRNKLRIIAREQKEWAGVPMPMEGSPLVVEPKYPNADRLMELHNDPVAPDESHKIRNTFWSWRYRTTIVIWNEGDKIEWGKLGVTNSVDMAIKTLGASDAWGIEQESAAVNTLGTLIKHRQFKQYMMTGIFMEKSLRSGLHYIFRRLRPTIVLSENGPKGMRILCALCLHPIGYYEGTWAGAMTPTDDVVAHLMLMRGDEHMFWRRANQHAPYRKEAAV